MLQFVTKPLTHAPITIAFDFRRTQHKVNALEAWARKETRFLLEWVRCRKRKYVIYFRLLVPRTRRFLWRSPLEKNHVKKCYGGYWVRSIRVTYSWIDNKHQLDVLLVCRTQLTSEKSDSLGPELGARIYGIIWGDGKINKHGGKRVECLSGVKTNWNNKKKGGIERKKNMEMSSWRKMCLGDFASRKTRRMQIRVLSEFNFKLAFRKKRTYSCWIRVVFGIL